MHAHHPGRPSLSGARPAANSLVTARRKVRILCGAGLLAVGAAVAGCGGGASGSAAAQGPDAGASSTPHEMASMNMGDPSATPADKVPGAELKKGTLKLLDTRPPGTDDVKGTAWLAQSAEGTTVTVSVTGLEPGTAYISHLHTKPCSDDNGGPHFRFDPDGPETPPNEVHLAFTGDSAGRATMTVNNDRKTGGGAVAFVIHPRDALDNMIACADF
ncbi:hypothetical protein [Actinomadura sp. 3N407]|uniref:hypothetical protein n=1 Tax=Actinomadura sp. 3N407 TaxID=3457423 RepID=UPI003FCD8198